MNSRLLLKDLLEQNRQIIDEVKQKYLHLPDEMLSRRPAPNKWSLNEIFEHLNLGNEAYFLRIEQALSAPNLPPFNPEFKPGLFGNFFTNFLSPKKDRVTNKIKAPAFFDPAKTGQNPMAIEKYLTSMQEFNEFMLKSQHTDLNKIRIPFMLFSGIRFRLGDVFRFVIAHSRRHLIQAQSTFERVNSN